ncbi:hypothetical protein IKG33_00945 [Candidatus Saccharibacteria bacterium]|nr:hypothetical protein [Candidatus Saccharibacteria bacterium]
MWKRLWKISNLKYVVGFLVPAIFVMLLVGGVDNDSWGVIAEGRYIVENGVYYQDVLSMHEGLNITVQNYGFAVIFYLIYSFLGTAGLYIGMLFLNFVVCYLIYMICMLLSDKNSNLSLLIMMITDVILALGFVTTRAQMVSYVIFLSLIYILELYIKSGKPKYLWLVPLLSILQVNLHASLWLMLIFVLGVYIIDSIKKPEFHLQGYKTGPLVVTLAGTLVVGLINPYGMRMLTLMLTSYGDTTLKKLVQELTAFSPFGGYLEIAVYLSIVGVAFLYIFGKKRSVRMRYFMMFFGFLALGLNTVKGLSQFILVLFFPLALMYKDARIGKIIDAEIARKALMFWVGAVTISVFVALCIVEIPRIKNWSSEGMARAMDVIDESSENNKNIKVYTGYNNGGYAEFRGYKAYLDPRGEVFLKKNNGKDDILKEWVDFIDRKIELNDFLDKYQFDYMIIDEWHEEKMYNMGNEKYKMIYEDGEEKIKVFKKIN